MAKRFLYFIALGLLSSVASVSAQPGPLFTTKNNHLLLPASTLLTNGLPGLSGPPVNLMVSSVQSNSAQSGVVSLLGSQMWERRYNGPVNNEDQAFAITVDKDGNIITGGYSTGSGFTIDYLTIKYTPDGVGLWTNRYDGPDHGSDRIEAIATDGSGGVYVSGESGGGITTIKYASDGTPGWNNIYTNSAQGNLLFGGLAVDNDGNTYLLPSDAGSDSFITVKYDFNGHPAWTNVFRSSPTSTEIPNAVAVDATGDIFVTGGSFDSGVFTFLTIKYASNGSTLWMNRYSLVGSESADRVIVDNKGNVIVIGDSQGGTAQHRYALVEYSNSGTLLWTNSVPAAAYVGGGVPQVTTDPSGNVFIVGATPGAGSAAADYTSYKFSNTGVPVWTNRFVDPNSGTAGLFGAATDNAGNLYWSIDSASPNNTNYNYVTLKYATNGAPVWTNRYNGAANGSDLPRAMTVGKAGDVYVTGTSSSTVGSSFGALDWATLKYADNLRYVPPTNFIGQDTITFKAYDSLGNSASGTVTVNVLPGPIAVVTPNNYTSVPGNGGLNTLVRSTNAPRTYQMQFTPDTLGGLPVGARIIGLGFRIYTNTFADFPSSTVSWSDYEVTLAQAANPVYAMSTTFQENMLNPVLVKSGPLSIGPGTFSTGYNPNPFATMITFNTPYFYQGGDLVMQFMHTGSDSATTALLDAVGPTVPGYGTSFSALSATTFNATTGLPNSPLTIVEIVFAPTITQKITRSANQLVITGDGGLAGETYQILTATNMALPANQWTPIFTNQFDASGDLGYTNAVLPNAPAQYFRVVLP
jgi:hypothetical protein